jgi:hypothetical protein
MQSLQHFFYVSNLIIGWYDNDCFIQSNQLRALAKSYFEFVT